MIQFRDICLDKNIGVLIKTYEQKREFKKWLEKKISWSIDYFARPPFIVYPYTEKITYLRNEKYDREDLKEPTVAVFPYLDVVKEKEVAKEIGTLTARFLNIKEKEEVKDLIEIDGVKYKRVEEEKPRGLYLEVNSDNYLGIYYKGLRIGFILDDGRCSILSCDAHIKTYEQWREDGMIIDETPVKWRGGDYEITFIGFLHRSDISSGAIYDFRLCHSSIGCQDENIMRFKHNDRPIIF